MALIPQVSI